MITSASPFRDYTECQKRAAVSQLQLLPQKIGLRVILQQCDLSKESNSRGIIRQVALYILNRILVS